VERGVDAGEEEKIEGINTAIQEVVDIKVKTDDEKTSLDPYC